MYSVGANRESDLMARYEVGHLAVVQSEWLEANLAVERCGLTDLFLCEVRQDV